MNYITILDFMVTELMLRGNELIVFALIYGFSQDGQSEFEGSISYIQERTGLSRPTVVDILKKLVDKKLVVKIEEFRNNLKICTYKTSKETLLGVVNFLSKGSKETLPPILYNKKYNKYIGNEDSEEVKTQVSEILKYLNTKTGKHFRIEAKGNRDAVRARINDGYTLKDFKFVIDSKTNDWKGTAMEEYLCPETLFRPNNFEKYLNKKGSTQKSKIDPKIEREVFEDE